MGCTNLHKRLAEFERIAKPRPTSTPPAKMKRKSQDSDEEILSPSEIRRREKELIEKGIFHKENGLTYKGDPHVPMVDTDKVKKQPIRHSSTGSYRRPSPRLIPIDSSLSARSSMKTSDD